MIPWIIISCHISCVKERFIHILYKKKRKNYAFFAIIKYLQETGFEIIKQTEDLQNEPIWENNIKTEHEKMFEEQGITTKALIAELL